MERMNRGCARLGFPSFDGEQLTELIKKIVALDEHWIPTEPGCSLYIRPTIIGTRASLGVGPSNELLLFVIASPVGPYYPGGWKPVSLLSSTKDVRAWPGGTGAHKFGTFELVRRPVAATALLTLLVSHRCQLRAGD